MLWDMIRGFVFPSHSETAKEIVQTPDSDNLPDCTILAQPDLVQDPQQSPNRSAKTATGQAMFPAQRSDRDDIPGEKKHVFTCFNMF